MNDEFEDHLVMSSEVEISLIVIQKNSERFLDFATVRSE
jgi:hypothetical protein